MISLLIPCRNELGNVTNIFNSIDLINGIDEVIFVEGGSTDGTYEKIEQMIVDSNDPKIFLIRQTKKGKFNAVTEGAMASSCENIAIWDADLTIDYIDQNNLIEVFLHSEPLKHEKFVTANRLNPQMDDSAMRYLNKIGNRFFAAATKLIAGIDVPDALAGSKIFPKKLLLDSTICKKALSLDPFGDLFLLSQIRKHQLKTFSLNCEYRARNYGTTKIKRWSGGMAMIFFLIHIFLHRCNKPI
jgi:glycosyltransferase involved in cell wall biosynthesis